MPHINSIEEQRLSFSRKMAIEIISVMSSTKTSFESLAEVLQKPIDEVRSLIYGFGDEMTVSQLQKITKFMNHEIAFYDDSPKSVCKDFNSYKYLKVIK